MSSATYAVSTLSSLSFLFFFFFNYTSTPEIYTLSLHDALPISLRADGPALHRDGVDDGERREAGAAVGALEVGLEDRKSTRLNSSHTVISYAVFCLKKKTATHRVSPRTAGAARVQQVSYGGCLG